MAEFFSYFLAIKAFIEKKNVSLAWRDKNLIYSFGTVFDDFEIDFTRLILEEFLDDVRSLMENNLRSKRRISVSYF
jgi:hypothetical protein